MPTRRAYLFSRRGVDWDDYDPVTLSTMVFFQMWRTRMAPYNAIAEGDAVYIGDPGTRRVHFEVRVASLLKDFQYRSTRHALSGLRRAYGMYAADLNDYHHERAGSGWLLAWAPQVMRKLEVSLPEGQHFGQNGYRELSSADLAACGLPTPKRSHVLASPPWEYAPSAADTGVPMTPSRYVTKAVVRAVWDRDGGQCAVCHASVDLHLDHIVPFVHGGTNDIDNLRLLCARSNLSRGAGDPDGKIECSPP